jgi:hypothetical protein
MSNPSLERQGNDRSDEVSSEPPANVTESSHRELRELSADPPGEGDGETVQAPQRP